jgi:hypothetical protein
MPKDVTVAQEDLGAVQETPAALAVDVNEVQDDSHDTVEPPATTTGSIDAGDEMDTTPNPQSRPAVSQPMTASNSSSSNPSVKDGKDGPSPYGTRSRNRGGASRPNYAEDREVELEFDMQASAKEEETKKAGRAADARSSIGLESGAPPNTSRRGQGIQSEQDTSEQAIVRDQIPGTSTFSANPAGAAATQPSKKRKAGNQSTPNTTLTPADGLQPGSQSTTRRASIAAQSTPKIRDSSILSNMLSFEIHGGRLKNGKLTADDGTVMGVNGEHKITSYLL